MKKTLILLIIIFFIIIAVISINIMDLQSQQKEIKNENASFEKYFNKEILGTELATLINKTVEQNEKNNIQKDNKNYYIENEENSIKIYLKMSTIEKTYPMEEIYVNNTSNFVKNFNFIKFKCTSIEYHKRTGKISKLIFEESLN